MDASMMDLGLMQISSVFWFGILTSITPCPLATNIAATTYIGKQVKSPHGTILAGAAYTLGRSLCYVLLCILIVGGLVSIPGVSRFLQTHMNRILGPVLLFTGLVILGAIPVKTLAFSYNDRILQSLGKNGLIGAIFLGFIFALSFCPVSAALFFGSVVPVSLTYQSSALLPLVYGIGTAVPVIGSAFILSFGVRFAGNFFNKLQEVEKSLRRITGMLFVLIGIYFIFKYLLFLIHF